MSAAVGFLKLWSRWSGDGALMCPFAWSGFPSTTAMVQLWPHDCMLPQPASQWAPDRPKGHKGWGEIYLIILFTELCWKWLLHHEKLNQIKKILSLKTLRFSQMKNSYLKRESTSCTPSIFSKKIPSRLPPPPPKRKRDSESCFKKSTRSKLFKFIPQAHAQKTCLFCLVYVSKHGVADLPCSPAVCIAQLQTEPDFCFRFGSQFMKKLNFEKSPQTKAGRSTTISQVQDFPIVCL